MAVDLGETPLQNWSEGKSSREFSVCRRGDTFYLQLLIINHYLTF